MGNLKWLMPLFQQFSYDLLLLSKAVSETFNALAEPGTLVRVAADREGPFALRDPLDSLQTTSL